MSQSNDQSDKVGTDPQAAKNFGGKGDFGVHESDRIERDYASRATKSQDKGGPPAHATGEGQRVSGVGANNSGPGSGSGGDLDLDVIGVGTDGTGLATSGNIHEPAGPDDSDGSSDVFGAAKPRDQKSQPDQDRRNRQSPQPAGTTVNRSGGDASTTGDGQGAAAVTNPMAENNDASAGEISLDEAAGADNSPSDMAREERS